MLSALNTVVVGQVEAPKKVEAPKVLPLALIESKRSPSSSSLLSLQVLEGP